MSDDDTKAGGAGGEAPADGAAASTAAASAAQNDASDGTSPIDGASPADGASAAATAPTDGSDASDEPARPARLKPARPTPDELAGKPEYMPRVPWGWILGGLSLVLALAIGYEIRDDARAEELRRQLLETHARELGDLPDRYRTFRDQLETWTIEAASAGEPERWVDPRLRIAGLHGGEGIYLRLLATDATSAEGIERGASVMEEDALTRCLGIAPASARGLYSSGRFLTEEFVDEIRTEPELMRLRVLDEMLASSMTSDVPVVSTLLRAEYFLLVIQQGETRRDSPVDVYLWDLGENRQLLRARFQARGILLPVRIDSLLPGIAMPPDPPGRPSMTSAGATDCSIAAQIKGLTGESPVTITTGVAEALRADEDAAEAAEGDGADAAAPADGTAPADGAPPAEGSAPAAPSDGTAPAAAPPTAPASADPVTGSGAAPAPP